jgi:hypothetical protein
MPDLTCYVSGFGRGTCSLSLSSLSILQSASGKSCRLTNLFG